MGRVLSRLWMATKWLRGGDQIGTRRRLKEGKQRMKQKAVCWAWCVINAASWGSFHAHWSRSLFRDRCLLGHARPCIGLHATNTVHFPPKPLSQPPFDAYPLGKTGIEQLLLNCNISAKTTCRVCRWKGVGIKTDRPPPVMSVKKWPAINRRFIQTDRKPNCTNSRTPNDTQRAAWPTGFFLQKYNM